MGAAPVRASRAAGRAGLITLRSYRVRAGEQRGAAGSGETGSVWRDCGEGYHMQAERVPMGLKRGVAECIKHGT